MTSPILGTDTDDDEGASLAIGQLISDTELGNGTSVAAPEASSVSISRLTLLRTFALFTKSELSSSDVSKSRRISLSPNPFAGSALMTRSTSLEVLADRMPEIQSVINLAASNFDKRGVMTGVLTTVSFGNAWTFLTVKFLVATICALALTAATS